MRSNGLVIYDGPSRINGFRVLGIVTGLHRPSRNPKTGPMLQLWIIEPRPPAETRADTGCTATCGVCPIRRACYVNPMGVHVVWRQWSEGCYPIANATELAGLASRSKRLGAWGDPMALPLDLLRQISHPRDTGYTHQWPLLTPRLAAPYAQLLMASVESEAGRAAAKKLGFRTFRITHGESAAAGEIVCPSLRGTKCIDCGLCAGARRRARDITIPVHGPYAKHLEMDYV